MNNKPRKSRRALNGELGSFDKKSHDAKKYIESTVEKIENAYSCRKVDEHVKIQLLLQCMFDRERLDGEYYSEAPIKSGTTSVEAIYRYMRKKDAHKETVELAKRYLSASTPSLNNVYSSPSGFFKIHYSLVGKDAVLKNDMDVDGIPGYIKEIGLAFDNTKAVTCDSRGFRKPIVDRGKRSLDVYVFDLKGKYGITFPQTYYSGKYNNLRTASSFICIDNSYSNSKGFKKEREDCMKVTAAHEFFHAVQNAYNVDADSWWKEASATWNEDEVFDSVNDYIQYLGGIFSSPGKSLEQSSYSGVIFAKFLSENFGGYTMLRRIWDYQATTSRNSVNAIDFTLRDKYKDEDIGTVYNKFTACNFNPSQYYKEGYLWTIPLEMKGNYSEYPILKQSRNLNHLAANYELFRPSLKNPSGRLKITIEMPDKKRMGIKVQKRRVLDDVCEITELNSSEGVDNLNIICDNFGKLYKEVCLISANLEKEYDSAKYNYEVNMI